MEIVKPDGVVENGAELIVQRLEIGLRIGLVLFVPISKQLVLPCNHIFCGDLIDFSFAEMSKLISCQFNTDTACVELVFDDGSQISIDCTAVENEVADNRFQRSALDYLIYNDPLALCRLGSERRSRSIPESSDRI